MRDDYETSKRLSLTKMRTQGVALILQEDVFSASRRDEFGAAGGCNTVLTGIETTSRHGTDSVNGAAESLSNTCKP
jgi:hypothetical protein